MEIPVFAKKRNTKEGKVFYTYITRMTKRNGDEITATVKFREECGAPDIKKCPCNIIIHKGGCNISKEEYIVEESGEVKEKNILWVNSWENGSEYVDRSMDEFDI